LTEGIKSLSRIPDSSIDFCFSNAVLEHINADDFDLLISEMRRILKPTSTSCHRVDLKDHLGGGLNNLRFSRRVWEGSLFKSSGFYTNRIRYNSYVTMFSSSGFCVETPRVERWNEIPIARRSLDAEFKNIPNDDLLVSGFDMVLKFNFNK
jgi:SAM-dependent methyltransferase